MVIRTTLDAFWARQRGTIKAHVREVRNMKRMARAMGFDPFPPLGPYPLGEHLGMMQATLMEMRGLDKGQKGGTVQFGTARGVRSTCTVLWESSPAGGGDLVLSAGNVKGRYILSRNPTESRWFELFARGMSVRKGDVVEQDRAYSIEVLHELIRMYEDEWEEAQGELSLEKTSSAMFLIASCTGGFRGYETVWTDLGALRYDLEYCKSVGDRSAVSWPVVGRFKGKHGLPMSYMIPIAGKTRSGIEVFKWTERFVERLEQAGRTSGWAFRGYDGQRAKASDYMEDIYLKLEAIQRDTNLIDPACNIRQDYGAMRSARRFFDTECLNQKVSETDIAFQCRWSTDRAKGGATVQRNMVHTYAEIRNMKPTLIRPSLAL